MLETIKIGKELFSVGIYEAASPNLDEEMATLRELGYYVIAESTPPESLGRSLYSFKESLEEIRVEVKKMRAKPEKDCMDCKIWQQGQSSPECTGCGTSKSNFVKGD
jgi:hypothetical protein